MYKAKERMLKKSDLLALGTLYILLVSITMITGVVTQINIDCGESSLFVDTDDQCLVMDAIPRYSTTLGSKISFQCASLLTSLPSAKISYCPIQVCTANGTWTNVSLSCARSECYEIGISENYRGKRACTASGIPCQPWTSQSPHRHKYNDSAYFPGENLTEIAAFCRDPEGRYGQPWCYTNQSNVEWEHCNIAPCTTYSFNEGHCVDESTSKECDFPDLQITTDNSCTDLADIPVFSTSIGATIEFGCKTFQTKYVSERGYCPVETCASGGSWTNGSISCAGNECYKKGASGSYTGFRNCIASGKPCIAWKEVENSIGVSFTDSESDDPGNFCRDPEGLWSEPYCHVDTTGRNTETCGIQICEEFLQTAEVCENDTDAVSIDASKNETASTIYSGFYQKSSSSLESIDNNTQSKKSFTKMKTNTMGEDFSKTHVYSNIGASVVTVSNQLEAYSAVQSSMPLTTARSESIYHILTFASVTHVTNPSVIMKVSTSPQQRQNTLVDSLERNDLSSSVVSTKAMIPEMETTIRVHTLSKEQMNASDWQGWQIHPHDISPSRTHFSSQINQDDVTSKQGMQTPILKSTALQDRYSSVQFSRQMILQSESVQTFYMTSAVQTSSYKLTNLPTILESSTNSKTNFYSSLTLTKHSQTTSSNLADAILNFLSSSRIQDEQSKDDVPENSVYNTDNVEANVGTSSINVTENNERNKDYGETSANGIVTDTTVSKRDYILSSVRHKDNLLSSVHEKDYLQSSVSNKEYLQSSVSDKDYLPSSVSDKDYFQSSISDKDYLLSSVRYKDNLLSSVSDKDYLQSSVSDKDTLLSSVSDKDYLQSTVSDKDYLQPSVSDKDYLQSSIGDENYLQSSVGDKEYLQFAASVKNYLQSSVSDEDFLQSHVSDNYYTQPSISGENYLQPSVSDKDYLQSSVSDKDYLQSSVTGKDYSQSSIYSFVTENSINDIYYDNLSLSSTANRVSFKDDTHSSLVSVITTNSVSDEYYGHSSEENVVVASDEDLMQSESTGVTHGYVTEKISDDALSDSENVVLYRLAAKQQLLSVKKGNKHFDLWNLDCARKCSKNDSCYSFDTNVDVGTCHMYSRAETNNQEECPNGHVCYGRM